MHGVQAADRAAFAIERAVRAVGVLYLRPSRVPGHPSLVGSRRVACLFALTVGVAGVQEALARRDFMGKADLLGLDTWPRMWLLTLGIGLVWAVFAYAFGGWWFQVRLWLSGVNPIDFGYARRMYLGLCQISALPGVAWLVVETISYSSPQEAREGSSSLALVLLVFAVWSIVAEFLAVRAGFEGDRGRIRTWFLTLPLAWPILLVGGLLVAFGD